MEPERDHLADERIVEILIGGSRIGRPSPHAGANEIPPEEAVHLERCAACAHRFAEVRQTLLTLDLAGRRPSDEVVERIWEAAKQRVDRESRTPLSLPGSDLIGKAGRAIREIVATLVPLPALPAFGVRGAGLGSAGIQVFETETVVVSITVLASDQGGRVRLLGSVAPKSATGSLQGGAAEIYGGQLVDRTPLDDAGEFEFDRLEPGEFHVELELGGDRIHISPVSAQYPALPPRD